MRKNRKWRSAFIIASVCTTVALAVMLALTRRPVIEFDSMSLDLGASGVDVPVTGSFAIKNTGSGKLYLSRIEANCKCTAVELEDHVLLPGDSTRLNVTMTTQGGSKQAIIFVKSNASNVANALLRVGMTDNTPIIFERKIIDLGYVVPAFGPYTGVVAITVGGDEITLQDADFVSRDPNVLSVNLLPQASRRFELQYTFEPGLYRGDVNSHVDFCSDRHGLSERICFIGNIKSRLFLQSEPVRLKIGDFVEGQFELKYPIELLMDTLIQRVEFLGADGEVIEGDFSASGSLGMIRLTFPKSIADSQKKKLGYLTLHGSSNGIVEIFRIPVLRL